MMGDDGDDSAMMGDDSAMMGDDSVMMGDDSVMMSDDDDEGIEEIETIEQLFTI